MIPYMHANISNIKFVIIILIHSAKTHLLHLVAKDVTSSSISRHKRYDLSTSEPIKMRLAKEMSYKYCFNFESPPGGAIRVFHSGH